MCPVATYKNLDHCYPKYPINLDFYVCPLKFAEIHHFTDDERLTIALEKYRTISAAKLNYSYSQNFVDEVKRLCEEYQLDHQFKRRKLGGSNDEEDTEEIHDDQETSLQEEKATTNEEKVKDDSQPKLKEREG
jgi:hypothetical protein